MTRTGLFATGFVVGWATCLFEALWGHKFSQAGQSQEKERVPDGGVWPTDAAHWATKWWRHSDGFTTHIAPKGKACQHCGATEDGAP